jgi:acyl carrier protein
MYVNDVISIIKRTLSTLPNIDECMPDCNLYEKGMTSLMAVNLMVELELHFHTEFPHTMLNASNFESANAINQCLVLLVKSKEATCK